MEHFHTIKYDTFFHAFLCSTTYQNLVFYAGIPLRFIINLAAISFQQFDFTWFNFDFQPHHNSTYTKKQKKRVFTNDLKCKLILKMNTHFYKQLLSQVSIAIFSTIILTTFLIIYQ